tara:strand:- start:541 stop:1206 length:666 start_codon:yes stop_codon:yes gene_type:complete
MIKNNNIDVFLYKKDLSNIFLELLPQLKNKELNFVSQLNINGDLSRKDLNQITILDENSLTYFINKKIDLNNYIFIVGNKKPDIDKYLNDNLINYEYFEPPVSFIKLLARCDNLLVEMNNSQSEIIKFKNLSYSFNLNTIYTNNSSLYLTDKENEIFQYLIKNVETTISRKQLLAKVWSYNENIDTHTLETHIYTLRKKIKKKLGLSDLILHEDDGYRVNI